VVLLAVCACAQAAQNADDAGVSAPRDAGLSTADAGPLDGGWTDSGSDAGAAGGDAGEADSGSDGCDGGYTFGQVQSEVLTQCGAPFGCHTTSPYAGGLDLTVANAYTSLVNVPSSIEPQVRRVAPGIALQSLLYQKLTNTQGPAGGLPMPFHEGLLWNELPADEIQGVYCWIQSGALETPGIAR
jgi:hypothetical protein